MQLLAANQPLLAAYGIPDYIFYPLGVLLVVGLGGLLWYMNKKKNQED